MLAGPPPPPADPYAYQRAQQRGDAINKLEGAALGVKILGWIVAIVGLIGGAGCVAVALSAPDEQAMGTLVSVGATTAVTSVIIGSVLIMFAHWADAWSEMQR